MVSGTFVVDPLEGENVDSQAEMRPRDKDAWEPMRLTPVGNLGTVMTDKTGSVTDTGGAAMKP